MLIGNGLFPPVQYSPLWGVLAVVVVLALAAFYVLVPYLTRSREARAPAPEIDASWLPIDVSALRGKYEQLITDVETAYNRGELSLRAAHQRLSLVLRLFAYETSGIRAPQMTLGELRELRDARAIPLSDAVAKLYPGAFEAIERGTMVEAADVARRVVHLWS